MQRERAALRQRQGTESGDEDDKPLSLEIIAPKKPKKPVEKPEREKVGVGAKKDDGDESGDADESSPADES